MDDINICSRCLMDTSDPEIEFTDEGFCNHCVTFLRDSRQYKDRDRIQREYELLIQKIKESGKNQPYDCIVGVSGGVDSTYVAYAAKKAGLRPLAVHVDNGWNSELAVSNIEKTLDTLGIDLYTYVIEWEEFRALQISFLKASVSDAELPTDHAIRAVLNQVARKQKIKYLLNGRNYSTEGILPWSWTYSPLDWKYLKSIHKRFSRVKLKKYPHMSFFKVLYATMISRLHNVGILNYIGFDKAKAMDVLQNELGWRDYGGKHYESIYTRFFQAYILPRKFNIDKRKAHLSVLIMNGQLSREDALAELQKPTCDPKLMKSDRDYVLKKLELSEDEFDQIMAKPVKTHRDYPNRSNIFLWSNNQFLIRLISAMKRVGLLPKGFAENAVQRDSTN